MKRGGLYRLIATFMTFDLRSDELPNILMRFQNEIGNPSNISELTAANCKKIGYKKDKWLYLILFYSYRIISKRIIPLPTTHSVN